MSRSTLAAAAVVAAMTLTIAPAVAADSSASTLGSITGSVSEHDPSGLSYAAAERVGEMGNAIYASTGVDGTYRFDGLRPGSYLVRFFDRTGRNAWEYFPGAPTLSEARVITVRAGQTVGNIDADLDPSGAIAGTVAFPPGTSLLNRPPTMNAYYLDGSLWRQVPSTVSSNTVSPAYKVAGLRAGTYRLRYTTSQGHGNTASGFLGGTDDAASSTPVQVVAGQIRTEDLTPRQGGVLQGRVVDPDGRPIADAKVQAYRRDADGIGYDLVHDEILTGPDGRYEISRLDTTDYYLGIRPPWPFQQVWSGGVLSDYLDLPHTNPSVPKQTVPVHVAAADTTQWSDEVVQPAGTLEGTVRDHDGQSVAGATVSASFGPGYVPSGSPSRRTQPTDADGHFSFGPLQSGPYRITVSDPAGAFNDTPYQNPAFEEVHQEYFSSAFVTQATASVANVSVHYLEPSVSDPSPVVGQSIAARLVVAGTELSSDPEALWTWQRNGATISGADDPSYRPTSADRGAQLTAVVTSERSGRRVVHASKATSRVSTSRPTVTLSAKSTAHGRVVLTVRASATGVPDSLLDGRIDIGRTRSGSDHLTTRTMHDGSLTVTLTGQPRGKRTYSATFLAVANRYTTSATTRRGLTVR